MGGTGAGRSASSGSFLQVKARLERPSLASGSPHRPGNSARQQHIVASWCSEGRAYGRGGAVYQSQVELILSSKGVWQCGESAQRVARGREADRLLTANQHIALTASRTGSYRSHKSQHDGTVQGFLWRHPAAAPRAPFPRLSRSLRRYSPPTALALSIPLFLASPCHRNRLHPPPKDD